MINTNGYRLGQLIFLQQNKLAEARKSVAYTKLTLNFAFATTWILYFIFAFSFYVADLWGISTWLTKNTSELVAFALFLLMALLMAQSLSMIKHAFYHHKAAFQYGVAALLVICSLGVFMELFNSSSQQQTIAHNTAEQSKSFEALNNTQITVAGGDHAGKIATLSGELATANEYLKDCKKTCREYRAKVARLEQQMASLQASDSAARETSKEIGNNTLRTKAELGEKLKEEAHKPVFKFIRDLLGVGISTAVVMIACLVAIGFEFSHALLSRMLGEQLARLAELEESLIKLRTEYLGETGSEYGSAERMNAPELPLVAGFKYQQAAPFVSGFASFKHPTPKPAHPVHSTFKAELEAAGVPMPYDPVLNQSADQAAIQRIIAGATGAPVPRTVHDTHGQPDTRQSPRTVHGETVEDADHYEQLKALIKAGQVEPTIRPIKAKLKEWEAGNSDAHRQRLASEWLERLFSEQVLMLNPANDGRGIQKAKYVLNK